MYFWLPERLQILFSSHVGYCPNSFLLFPFRFFFLLSYLGDLTENIPNGERRKKRRIYIDWLTWPESECERERKRKSKQKAERRLFYFSMHNKTFVRPSGDVWVWSLGDQKNQISKIKKIRFLLSNIWAWAKMCNIYKHGGVHDYLIIL